MTTTMRQALERLREQLRQELIYLNCIELSDIGLESLHCKTQFAKEIDAILAIPSPERDQPEHGRNCPARVLNASDDCTCGLVWRIQIQTEQEMQPKHGANARKKQRPRLQILRRTWDAVADECCDVADSPVYTDRIRTGARELRLLPPSSPATSRCRTGDR